VIEGRVVDKVTGCVSLTVQNFMAKFVIIIHPSSLNVYMFWHNFIHILYGICHSSLVLKTSASLKSYSENLDTQ